MRMGDGANGRERLNCAVAGPFDADPSSVGRYTADARDVSQHRAGPNGLAVGRLADNCAMDVVEAGGVFADAAHGLE
jgi:hypothetical protein